MKDSSETDDLPGLWPIAISEVGCPAQSYPGADHVLDLYPDLIP